MAARKTTTPKATAKTPLVVLDADIKPLVGDRPYTATELAEIQKNVDAMNRLRRRVDGAAIVDGVFRGRGLR